MTFQNKIIAAAQIGVRRGDIEHNLQKHKYVMEKAAQEMVNVLVFPELSITGYELDLAAKLQTTLGDSIFAPLQTLAQDAKMLTLLGMPLKAPSGKPYLSAIILGGSEPDSYSKNHVHHSELPYFQPNSHLGVIDHHGLNVGCAICADLTHPSHAAETCNAGANLYAVGALINKAAWQHEEGMLAGYAKTHNIPVAFSNHASKSGNYTPVGNSSIWAPGGELIARSSGTKESLVIGKHKHNSWEGKLLSL